MLDRHMPPTHVQKIRILYAFDVERQAVLLIGGNKTGKDRFYEVMIPNAERLWKQYLVELDAARRRKS